MDTPETSARLRFLSNSAHLLATTAPATSKYLMSRCNSLSFHSGLAQSESQKRQTCGGCGTIIIVGWDATLKVQKLNGGRELGKPKKGASKTAREMVYTCESCNRKTHFQIPPPAIKRKSTSIRRAKIGDIAVPAHANPEPVSSITSANSNSKKRAKARKGGLGALLASKKAAEASQSGFGLDLMDFMKKA